MFVFASDLDQTLIFSKSAIEKSDISTDVSTLQILEYFREAPASYMTDRALKLLCAIASKATFIPATTRTTEQYQRIDFSKNGIFPPYAITGNGGNILIGGEPDLNWHAQVKKKVAAHCLPLSEVSKIIIRLNIEYGFLHTLKDAEGLFVYCVIDRDKIPEAALAELKHQLSPYAYRISLQGRKLYCIPKFVDKALALQHLLQNFLPCKGILAAGDSLLDIDMLLYANCSYLAAHGELATSFANEHPLPKHVTMTKQFYFAATEEILQGVFDHVCAGLGHSKSSSVSGD